MAVFWRGLLLAVTLMAAPAAFAQSEAPLTPAQRDAVKALVREVIRDNPEIVLEALNELERRQEAEKQARAEAAITGTRTALERDPADPTFGPADADVTIVEFFDYRCPYCKQVTERLFAAAKADPKVRIVFKEYPILGPASVLAARGAIAARNLGKYTEYHQAMMASRAQVDEAMILKTAVGIGITADTMKAEMAKPEVEAYLQKTLALGKSIGITGTPAFIVGRRLVPGAIDDATLKELIEEARKAG